MFDELIPGERLDELKFSDVVAYRKKSESARGEFVEHLAQIQSRHSTLTKDDDYNLAISDLVRTEIMPAARAFRNKLRAIDETLYGALAKGAIGGVLTGVAGLSLFDGLSWEKLFGLCAPAASYLAKAVIDQIVSERALRRECAISYVLSLDQ